MFEPTNNKRQKQKRKDSSLASTSNEISQKSFEGKRILNSKKSISNIDKNLKTIIKNVPIKKVKTKTKVDSKNVSLIDLNNSIMETSNLFDSSGLEVLSVNLKKSLILNLKQKKTF